VFDGMGHKPAEEMWPERQTDRLAALVQRPARRFLSNDG